MKYLKLSSQRNSLCFTAVARIIEGFKAALRTQKSAREADCKFCGSFASMQHSKQATIQSFDDHTL